MAKGVQYANAAEIFTLVQQGVNVPLPIRAAARRTLQGAGSPADAEAIRNFIGIKRSGRRDVQKAVSQIKNIRGTVTEVETAAEMVNTQIAQGANPIPAGIRLVQTMSDKFQDFLKTKLVKNVAVQVGKVLGSDAQASKAMLLGLRRAGALAGAWAGAVGLGVDIGSRIGLGLFDATAKRNASAGKSFDAARSRNIDIASFGLQSRALRQSVIARRGLYESIRDYMGFDEETTDEQEKRIEQRATNIERERPFTNKNLSGNRLNANALLVYEARRKGKTVDELTDRERNEILDRANRSVYLPDNYVGSTSDHDYSESEIFNDPAKVTEGDEVDPRILTKIALKGATYWNWFSRLDATRRKAEYERIAEEELIPELQKGKEIRQADMLKAAENTREALYNTPEKKAALRQSIATAQANWQAEYSRHKQVEFD